MTKVVASKMWESSDDRVGLLTDLFLALGTPSRFNELSNTGIWWTAVEAAKHAADDEFLMGLERVHNDPWGVLGAKEPFFRGGYYQKWKEPDRTYWTTKIADAVLSNGWDYEKSYVIKKVADLDTPKAFEFLTNVARGMIGREIDYRGAQNYYAGNRATAYLYLAMHDRSELEREIEEILSVSNALQDIAALKCALALCGRNEYLTMDLYDSHIDDVQSGFLQAIVESGDDTKIQFLVDMMKSHLSEEDEEDGGYYVSEDEFIAFEQATGQRFRSTEEMQEKRWYPSDDHLKRAIAYWESRSTH